MAQAVLAAPVILLRHNLQVQVFEGLLPSYYNHKNYLSFVRQLNFYGEDIHIAGDRFGPDFSHVQGYGVEFSSAFVLLLAGSGRAAFLVQT